MKAYRVVLTCELENGAYGRTVNRVMTWSASHAIMSAYALAQERYPDRRLTLRDCRCVTRDVHLLGI
jgi:hypothetical protein